MLPDAAALSCRARKGEAIMRHVLLVLLAVGVASIGCEARPQEGAGVKANEAAALFVDADGVGILLDADDAGLMFGPTQNGLRVEIKAGHGIAVDPDGLRLDNVFAESGDTVRSVVCNVTTGKSGITVSWREWTIGPTGQVKAIGPVQSLAVTSTTGTPNP